MNKNQRHEFEYLLHILDDGDIKVALAILSSWPERRRAPRPRVRMPFHLTPRLMLILTTSTAAVSVISWLAAGVAPYALLLVPLFVFYCAVIVVIRARSQTAYWVGR